MDGDEEEGGAEEEEACSFLHHLATAVGRLEANSLYVRACRGLGPGLGWEEAPRWDHT